MLSMTACNSFSCFQRLRSEGALRDSTFSIDEERFDDDPDMDENKPSPFTRSSRKSMRLDDRWGLWQETLDTMDFNVSGKQFICKI